MRMVKIMIMLMIVLNYDSVKVQPCLLFLCFLFNQLFCVFDSFESDPKEHSCLWFIPIGQVLKQQIIDCLKMKLLPLSASNHHTLSSILLKSTL